MQRLDYPCRVLVFEVNEISWELMRDWLDHGELRHFSRLQSSGAWAHTITEEPPEWLDPWITWTTLYTGVPQAEHGMQFLEQPSDSIRAKRLWDIVNEESKTVGVFGSVGSWPPKRVNGFFIPDSFSPDNQTYPETLRDIQELNLRYVRAHLPGAQQPNLAAMSADALRMVKFGLDLRTAFVVARNLAETKLHPERSWKKVSLQPLLNFRFFSRLYSLTQPDFATFHTNHVAHYQHRFYRAWKPALFPDPTDSTEIENFTDAIHYGYLVADQILGQFMDLTDQKKDLVLCVASSMGQKPWIPSRYGDIAPETCRIRSIDRLIRILGIDHKCEVYSTMAPQWNICIRDESVRRTTIFHLNSARYQPTNKAMYSAVEVHDTIVVTPISHHGLSPTEICSFSTLVGSPGYRFDDLVMQEDDTRSPVSRSNRISGFLW